jgi:hypothetical protein
LAASGQLGVSKMGLPVPEYDVTAYGTQFQGGRPRVASPQGERLDTLLKAIGRE